MKRAYFVRLKFSDLQNKYAKYNLNYLSQKWFVLLLCIIVRQIFSLARDLSNRVKSLTMSHCELNCVIFPNFQISAVRDKHLKDNKLNSLHLAPKCAWIFVHGHYLFLKVHSFPRASLSKTVYFLEQIIGSLSNDDANEEDNT